MNSAVAGVPAGFLDPNGPTSEDLVRCVRCGLCLSACPTYQELGLETDSPRGRIHLMRGVGDGRLELSEGVVMHLDRCLGCRACETVCPSDVPYGRLIERMRGVIENRQPTGGLRGTLQRVAFRQVLPSQPVLRLLGTLARLQDSPLGRLAIGAAKKRNLLSPGLSNALKLAPKVPARFYRRPEGGVVRPDGPPIGKVGLFTGCVMPVLFGPTQQDTQDVLVAAGYEVHVPEPQTCCGALQAHSGERELAKQLAKRNIDAFGDKYDLMVVNSAGCGTLMKEYGDLLEHDPGYQERAAAFSAKVRDISEVLADLDLEPILGRIDARISYQDACHLAHGQKVRSQPRRLLRAIPGLTFVELPSSDRCCGSAGIYNLTQPEIAGSLLERKVDDIAKIDVQYLVAGNPGCLIQIQAGLRDRGLKVKTVHTVSLIAESIRRGRAERLSAGA